MPDELLEAPKEWAAMVATPPGPGTLIDRDDPTSSDYLVKPAVMLNWSDFHARGLKLAGRLKQEVGAAFLVIYEKSWAAPACQEGQQFEVLDDGSVVRLPSGAIGRYSIGT